MKTNIDNIIKKLEKLDNTINLIANDIIENLAKIGKEVAKEKFDNAIYDGDSNITVDVYPNGELKMRLCATGQAVVYIEFGAGKAYEADHPQRHTISPPIRGIGSTPRSASGKYWIYNGVMGKNPTPDYRGAGDVIAYTEPAHIEIRRSNNNIIFRKERLRVRVLKAGTNATKGNPPARAMLDATINMRNSVIKVIEEAVKKYA